RCWLCTIATTISMSGSPSSWGRIFIDTVRGEPVSIKRKLRAFALATLHARWPPPCCSSPAPARRARPPPCGRSTPRCRRGMGGRICSMVAAGAAGLPPPRRLKGVVTIAYPLHPPGRPDRLRVEHLPDVAVPWLFVHGTKDPFASPDELRQWSRTVGGPVTHH